MCSMALLCLMAVTNPGRGGPLHFESAFVLEIMRRMIVKCLEHGATRRARRSNRDFKLTRKDLVQGSTDHQLLKKYKKGQKSYRLESTDAVKSMFTEDPFLRSLFPEAAPVIRACMQINPTDYNRPGSNVSVCHVETIDVLLMLKVAINKFLDNIQITYDSYGFRKLSR
ncbi:unnamed protein product [Peronospora belbahrii]|uniref:Uncharacterized protein n=1 Tax=Peronospora belbahrii TaxID=622444 RepID=A0ABN8CN60_9STRA|nr:unnamed protein product [Peronospora belbahrii]